MSARRILLPTFVWLMVALVFVTQNYLAVVTRHDQPNWLFIAGIELEYWFTFLIFTPFFAFMARRYPVGRGRLPQTIVAHLAAGVVFAIAQPILSEILRQLTLRATREGPSITLAAALASRFPVLAVIALWKYAIIIAVYHTLDYYRDYRDQQLRVALLERDLAAARLSSLQSQLQPHFLFNALNSASALTLIDPPKAHEALARLGDLLRASIDGGLHAEGTLGQDLAFVERYLAIERLRFEDRIMARIEVPGDLRDALVPSLILQPLVENVIHHVVGQTSAPTTLTIRAQRDGDRLILDVEDDGPGLPPAWSLARDARTGLASVQARATLAGGAENPIAFGGVDGRGLRVRLSLPLRYPDNQPATQ